MVEFAIVLPLVLLLLTGMLEFGFVFNHDLTLEYSTREGARMGSALGNGTGSTVACADIDGEIIAAVERVITAPGSAVALKNVSEISIWKATPGGSPVKGSVNTWTYTGPSTGPVVSGSTLAFTPGAVQWPACKRLTDPPADSLGVSVSYTYQMVGPIASFLRMFGGTGMASMPITDQTVMALNPTY